MNIPIKIPYYLSFRIKPELNIFMLFTCVLATVCYVDAPVSWDASQLTPGSKCDVQDGQKNWVCGEVMAAGTSKDFVRVSIVNSAVPRNITLPRSSPRLAAAGSHTLKQNSNADIEEGSLCENIGKERLEELLDLARGISSTTPATETTLQDISCAVETILMLSHPPELIPSLNAFLKEVLVMLVRAIERDNCILEGYMNLLQKLFFVDR